jgi:transmembrane sensor
VTPSDEEIRTAIAEQAGAWFIAQAGALAEEERASFLTWLKASPVHVREYLGVARIAHQLPIALGPPQVPLESFLAQVGDDQVLPIEVPTPRPWQPATRFSTRSWWPVVTTMAAVLVLVFAAALWWPHDGEFLDIPKTYRTAHGQQSVQRLPDGSLLHLDTDSEAVVRYSPRERVVELNRGQALFKVAHETSRRFRVAAGAAGIIAVGTRFDVYRKSDVTEITVADGEVAVFAGAPSWLDALGGLPSEVRRVTAGYQVRIDGSGPPAQPVPADLNQTLGWVQHKIDFQHRPLGEVAAEFNRYGKIPVEIEDEELRALPVSGMFDAADTESFVTFLETLPGVRVERTAKRIRVLKVTPTT